MSNNKVKLYEEIVKIKEHNQLPLNPHPPFANLTGYICYPNQFYGSKQFQIEDREVKLLVAENEYLKIAMAPEYGGRLWYMYDKLKEREVIHRVNTDAKVYNAGMGFNYMGGGLELNLPNAHSQTNVRKRAAYAQENGDGSVSLIMQNIEKIGRVHWTVSFTLRPGEARVEQKVRIANETPVEARYLYWANCGVPADGDSEFIYPEKNGAVHGDYINKVSWPYYDKTNIALMKNLDEMLGLYMLDAQEGYFGCYNHREKSGLLHYADVNDLPAKKTWTWGWADAAQHTANTHSDNGKCYLEIQAGRITIQEELERIMPMSSAEWTEYWYPYNDIGIVNGVSENGATNFSIEATGDKSAVANIKLFANHNLEDLTVILFEGDNKLKELPLKSLSAGKAELISIELERAAEECKKIALAVIDSSGDAVISALPELIRKQTEDSFFAPHLMPENKAEDFSAEGIFSKAEILLKDWFDHLPEVTKLLNAALKADPGFSRAHIELGMISLKGGQLETALEHFDRALERIVDDGRTIYYKGLTLWLLGRVEEARASLRRSSRFGYECQERVVEAMISIGQNNLKDAYRQLEKAELSGGGILLIKVLKALLLKRNDRADEALSVLNEAEKITPDNPFIYCLRYLLNTNNELKEQVRNVYSGLQSEILEVIAVLSFAGLNKEAYALFELVDSSNDIVELYRKHIARTLALDTADNIPPVGGTADFAWRLEEFMILKRAIEFEPENAENYFHIGNFYYGHGFCTEGIEYWEKAIKKGFSSTMLTYQLYRAYNKLGNCEKAVKYINEAYHMDSSDPYIFDDYVEMIFSKKGIDAGIKFMEDNLSTVMNYFSSTHKLLNSYAAIEAFDKMEELLAKIEFGEFWRASLGVHWVKAKQALGYIALRDKDYDVALKYFNESSEIPANVSLYFTPTLPQQARKLFYQGICHAKLGDNVTAAKCWEAVLDVKLLPRFEPSTKFLVSCTRFFHVFALKALGRYTEAETNMLLIKETAFFPRLPATAEKSLRKLGNMAEKLVFEDFDKFDTPIGIASNLSVATSVED